MSTKWILKMYNELKNEETKHHSLQAFYSIPDKRLQISFYQQTDCIIIFKITFERMFLSNVLHNNIDKYSLININQFANDTVNIMLRVKYPKDFPFKPPIWHLIDYSDNICSDDISIYYNYIIHQHNEKYNIYWSPVITLRIDFLILLIKIIEGIKFTLNR